MISSIFKIFCDAFLSTFFTSNFIVQWMNKGAVSSTKFAEAIKYYMLHVPKLRA